MRIGIVNDLGLAREALRRAVLSVPGHHVSWTACDGAEAIEWTRRDRPDLILMDLVMPGIDGVEATRRIMDESPCPILVVTATSALRSPKAPSLSMILARTVCVAGPSSKLHVATADGCAGPKVVPSQAYAYWKPAAMSAPEGSDGFENAIVEPAPSPTGVSAVSVAVGATEVTSTVAV